MQQDQPLNLSRNICRICGKKRTRPIVQWPFRCVCGHVYQRNEIGIEIPEDVQRLQSGGRCELVVRKGKPGFLLHEKGLKRKDTVCPINRWGKDIPFSDRIRICHDCQHFIKPDLGSVRERVGFISAVYMPIGGTETWHQSLIPRLKGVGGFVSLSEDMSIGDFRKLGVPFGIGIEDAKKLAASVDVLIVWGAGDALGSIVGNGDRPKVISVSHCDNRSDWTCSIMNAQARWTDHCVYICPTGMETIPECFRMTRATCIPNGPDPNRLLTDKTRAQVRQEHEVRQHDKLMVVASRLSPEKNIGVLMQAVELLGDGWQLRVFGKSSGWSRSHRGDLRLLETERVRVLEPIKTPAEPLLAADGYLSASEFEGYGLSSAEAMLAGVPVISTLTGLLEYDSSLAAIVPHEATAEDWANAIRLDFQNKEAQRARVAKAKRIMETDHSVEKFAASWDALIDAVRSGNNKGFRLPMV